MEPKKAKYIVKYNKNPVRCVVCKLHVHYSSYDFKCSYCLREMGFEPVGEESMKKTWMAVIGDAGYTTNHKVLRGTQEDVARYVKLLGGGWRFYEVNITEATHEFVNEYEHKRNNYLDLVAKKRELEEQIKEAAKEIVH